MDYQLQPLRIISGWTVEWNIFYEADPSEENMHLLSGSSLLHLTHPRLLKSINLEWRPEDDPNGTYLLRFINLTKYWQAKSKKYDYDGDWEHPVFEIESRSREEIVRHIESLCLTLKPFKA